MARWLGTVNIETDFDISTALKHEKIIYWGKNHFNYQIGDIFYLYVAGKPKRVKYKFKVENIISTANYPKEQIQYWNSERYLKRRGEEQLGLKLLGEVDTFELSLKNFRDKGFIGKKTNIQGRINDRSENKTLVQLDRINKWFDFIDDFFCDSGALDFPEEVNVNNESFPEGGKKIITVNKYERDARARSICIKEKGVNCFVCEMNFEKIYGAFAKGFIHVHHIKPLHQIQEKYCVDPVNDLIPVCPNCHAMLHRKDEDGSDMSIEKLKRAFLK